MEDQKPYNFKISTLIVLCGLFIGFVNGFFGAGGGMICVPILLLLGIKNKKAHATAVLTMLPISIASSVVYYSNGAIYDLLTVFWVGLGSCAGAVLGAIFLKKIPTNVLSFIFSVVMLLAGVRMLF